MSLSFSPPFRACFWQLAGIASGPPLVEGAEEDERTAEEDATAAVEENARSSRVLPLLDVCRITPLYVA